MTHAARHHRALDAAHAEAVARDRGGEAPTGANYLPLVSSRQRMMDLRTMSRPRVLLAKLSVRTSAKGKQYLSGWLGKASVVGFPGEVDKFGNAVWDIFVSEPEVRPGTALPDNMRQRVSAAAGADADWDGVR